MLGRSSKIGAKLVTRNFNRREDGHGVVSWDIRTKRARTIATASRRRGILWEADGNRYGLAALLLIAHDPRPAVTIEGIAELYTRLMGPSHETSGFGDGALSDH